jgi:hypothetical protein
MLTIMFVLVRCVLSVVEVLSQPIAPDLRDVFMDGLTCSSNGVGGIRREYRDEVSRSEIYPIAPSSNYLTKPADVSTICGVCCGNTSCTFDFQLTSQDCPCCAMDVRPNKSP